MLGTVGVLTVGVVIPGVIGVLTRGTLGVVGLLTLDIVGRVGRVILTEGLETETLGVLTRGREMDGVFTVIGEIVGGAKVTLTGEIVGGVTTTVGSYSLLERGTNTDKQPMLTEVACETTVLARPETDENIVRA